MAASLPSQSFRSAPAFELPEAVRRVIADMPVVIFANAIRDAFFRPQPAARRPVSR
jgi:hypothetical protein